MGIDKRQHTEFGGGQGSPARLPDGSPTHLSASEKARIARIRMMRDVHSASVPRRNPVVGSGELGPVYEPDVRAIEDMARKTNDYTRRGDGDAGGERVD